MSTTEPPESSALENATARSRPDPRLAFWLSVVVPGLGQTYAGALVRGLLFFTAALLGFSGITMGMQFGGHLPQYVYYGALSAVLLAAAWSGSVLHARAYASRATQWPRWYRFLGSAVVRRAVNAALTEIAMACIFLAWFLLLVRAASPSTWLPAPPRYWFLYEVFAAVYLALFHGAAASRGPGIEARLAGLRTGFFAVITLVASVALAVFRIVPAGDLAMAFLLALPSCLYALRHRGMGAARVQAGRVIVCLIAGYALIPFAALFHDVYRWMRRPWSMDEFVVLGGALYYLLRAAYAACAAQPVQRTRANQRADAASG